jgi:hypothetical protein
MSDNRRISPVDAAKRADGAFQENPGEDFGSGTSGL